MQYSVVNYKTVKENIDFRYEPEFWLLNYIEEEKRLDIITPKAIIFPNKITIYQKDL